MSKSSCVSFSNYKEALSRNKRKEEGEERSKVERNKKMPKGNAVSQGRDWDRIIKICSVLLWSPYAAAMLAIAAGQADGTVAHILLALAWMSGIIGATYFTAVHAERGDWLMLVGASIGLLSEVSSFGLSGKDPTADMPRWVWLVASGLNGVFSGVLCKAKDVQEERYFPGYAIAERLYVVVPFTLGQWLGYVLLNGWSGIVTVFSTIMLCLSTVGYGVFTFKIMKYFGVSGDLLELVEKVFNSSFGVVFGGFVVFGSFVFYLAIPFMTTLMALNALISGVGIAMEFIIYDVIQA